MSLMISYSLDDGDGNSLYFRVILKEDFKQ